MALLSAVFRIGWLLSAGHQALGQLLANAFQSLEFFGEPGFQTEALLVKYSDAAFVILSVEPQAHLILSYPGLKQPVRSLLDLLQLVLLFELVFLNLIGK